MMGPGNIKMNQEEAWTVVTGMIERDCRVW